MRRHIRRGLDKSAVSSRYLILPFYSLKTSERKKKKKSQMQNPCGGREKRMEGRGEAGERERGRRRRESDAWLELQDKEKCQITARAKNRTDWACVSNQRSQEHTLTHIHGRQLD